MMGVDPVPGELLIDPPHGRPFLLLLFVLSVVEMLVFLCPGDHGQQTRLLALRLSGEVGLEITVELGLTGSGEMVRPHIDLWGGLGRVEVRQADHQLYSLALKFQLHSKVQRLRQFF